MKTVNSKVRKNSSASESTGLYVKTRVWKEVVASAVLSVVIVSVAIIGSVPYSNALFMA